MKTTRHRKSPTRHDTGKTDTTNSATRHDTTRHRNILTKEPVTSYALLCQKQIAFPPLIADKESERIMQRRREERQGEARREVTRRRTRREERGVRKEGEEREEMIE